MMKPIVVTTFILVALASLAACGPSLATPTLTPTPLNQGEKSPQGPPNTPSAPPPTSVPTPEPTFTPRPTVTPTPEPTATPSPTVPPTATPTTHAPPGTLPSDPNWQDRMYEGRVRDAINNIPDDEKIWVDDDTVVYLMISDPHDLNSAKVAVVHHIPSDAAVNYDVPGAAPFSEYVDPDRPDGRAQADRMAQDPEVAKAVAELLGRQ